MTPPPWPDLIATRLFYGRDRAVPMSLIAEQLGCSRRIVERAVETLRAEGRPVCSGPDGVWLSDNAAEIAACADALEGRLRQQYATIKALRETAARFSKVRQMEMFNGV